MKKVFIYVSLCLLFLTACNSKKYTEGIEKATQKKVILDTSYESTFKSNGHVRASAEGYYFLNELRGSEEVGKNLPFWSFYNIDTNSYTPLCSKLNCDHGTISTCDAVFYDKLENERAIGSLYDNVYVSDFSCYGGRLFRISYTEKDGTRLLSYDRTGNDMVVDRAVEPDANFVPIKLGLSQSFTVYRGYLYMYLKSNNESGKIISRYIRAKLGSDEPYEVLLEYQCSQFAEFFYGVRIFADGDKIYMYRPLGGREGDLHHFAIYSYDINTLEIKELYNSVNSWDESLFIKEPEWRTTNTNAGIYSEFFVASGNDIYIYAECYSQVVVYHLDTLTGKMSILDLEDDNKYIGDRISVRQTASAGAQYLLCVDDKYIYYLSIPLAVRDEADYIQYFTQKYLDGYNYRERSQKILYVYDKDTLEVVYKCDKPLTDSNTYFYDLDALYNNDREMFDKNVVFCYTFSGESWNIEGVDDRYLIISANERIYMGLDISTIGTGNEKWVCMLQYD